MGGPWVYVPVTQPNLRQPTVPLRAVQSIVFDSYGRLFEAGTIITGMTRMMKPRLREGGPACPGFQSWDSPSCSYVWKNKDHC